MSVDDDTAVDRMAWRRWGVVAVIALLAGAATRHYRDADRAGQPAGIDP